MNMEKQMGKIQGSMLAGCLALGLTACGSAPVYEDETFNADTPYQRSISIDLDRACDGARLALLSQGYAVDDTRPHYLKGNKAFQPDDDVHATIEFYVVCAKSRTGTTLYANAVESRYDLKKTRNAAGFSVPSVGSISLPWGSSVDSLVKVAGETVTDVDFYRRFFDLVEQQLGIAPNSKE